MRSRILFDTHHVKMINCAECVFVSPIVSEELNRTQGQIERSAVVVVVTRPLPRDGGIAEDHGAPESWQLLRAWTRDRKETDSHQKVSNTRSP